MKFPYQENPVSIADQIRSKIECEKFLRECLREKSTIELISLSQNNGAFPFGLYGITEKDVNQIESDILMGFNTGDSFQVIFKLYNSCDAKIIISGQTISIIGLTNTFLE